MALPAGALYLREISATVIPRRSASITISQLRMRFKLEKTERSAPNQGKLQIFNLSPANRDLVSAKQTRLQISAGYQQTIKGVFIGDITRVAHKRKDTDIITDIELGDGDYAYRLARSDTGFPPGTPYINVYKKLASDLGVGVGEMTGIPTLKYAHGLSLSGNVRDHLDVLTRAHNLRWSIQDERLQIVPAGKLKKRAIALSAENGLVGSPERGDKSTKIRLLLRPDLRPGMLIDLKAYVGSGLYRIRSVEHEGDNQEGDFLTTVEATLL